MQRIRIPIAYPGPCIFLLEISWIVNSRFRLSVLLSPAQRRRQLETPWRCVLCTGLQFQYRSLCRNKETWHQPGNASSSFTFYPRLGFRNVWRLISPALPLCITVTHSDTAGSHFRNQSLFFCCVQASHCPSQFAKLVSGWSARFSAGHLEDV